MAVVKTKTITGTTGSPYWTWKIIVSELTGDTATMTSPVMVDLYLGRTSTAGGSYFYGNCTLNYSAGGQNYSQSWSAGSRIDVSAGGWYKIGSHTFTVSNVGGPNTISVAGSMSGANFSPNSASASGSISLEILHTPPRIIGVDDVELNSAVDNNYLYQYLSKKRFTIQAEAYEEETIAEYNIYIDNTRIGHSTSSNVIEVDFRQAPANIPITQYASGSTTYGLLVFEVKDTLNSVSRFNIQFTTMFYEKPNLAQASSTVKRNGQATGKVNLSLAGTFYNTNVGTKRPNLITLSFAYWATNSSESSTYYNIPSSAISLSGNNITINNWAMLKNNVLIQDVDKQYSYYFKIRAVDSFNNSTTIQLLCTSGEWLMAKFKDRVDFKKMTIKEKPVHSYTVLFEGTPTKTPTLSDNVSNYEVLLVLAGVGDGTVEAQTYSVLKYSNKFVGRWRFSASSSFHTHITFTASNTSATLTVNEIAGWDASVVKIYKIVGYK